MVGNTASGASTTCNGTEADCDPATSPNKGLAFNTTISDTAKIVPGPNLVLETTTPAGDDILVGAIPGTSGLAKSTGAERIAAGPNGVIDTVPVGDDVLLPAVSYTFQDWRDVLRMVYAGMDFSKDANNNFLNVKNCGSAARFAIVDNYASLFQIPCTTGNCTELRHAWRRDDSSGTTDTFVTLIGIKAATPVTATACFNSFCNGFTGTTPPEDLRNDPLASPGTPGAVDWDYQDYDPIRRRCNPDEQVCNRRGSLGVVQAIVPTDFLAPGDAFPIAPSDQPIGVPFIAAPAPKAYHACNATGSNALLQARCPNGDISQAFLCVTPQTGDAGPFPAGEHHPTTDCAAAPNSVQNLNAAANKPAGIADPAGTFAGFGISKADGRAYNLVLRKADTSIATDTHAAPPNRQITGAVFRIHSGQAGFLPFTLPSGSGRNLPTAALTCAVANCVNQDATTQIGCLTGVEQCSIGFAGRQATIPGTVDAMKVNQLDPTDACVQKLLNDPANAYKISRRLFLDTAVGFESAKVNPDELAMAQCFSKSTYINPIIDAHAFVKLPAAPVCYDYNEQAPLNPPANSQCGLPGPSTDACAGNAAIPVVAGCPNCASIPDSTGLALP